jgi:hypothetical protein
MFLALDYPSFILTMHLMIEPQRKYLILIYHTPHEQIYILAFIDKINYGLQAIHRRYSCFTIYVRTVYVGLHNFQLLRASLASPSGINYLLTIV